MLNLKIRCFRLLLIVWMCSIYIVPTAKHKPMLRRIMSIEKALERIATALENPIYRVDPTTPVEVKTTTPPPDKPEEVTEPEHAVTLADVRAGVEQFLDVGRREEAVLLMAGFGAEKLGDFKPEQYKEILDKFNAEFNS